MLIILQFSLILWINGHDLHRKILTTRIPNKEDSERQHITDNREVKEREKEIKKKLAEFSFS
jgi:hypothetical protein